MSSGLLSVVCGLWSLPAMNATLKEPNISVAVKGLGNVEAAMLPAMARGLDAGLKTATGKAIQHFMRGPRPAVLGEVTGQLIRSLGFRVLIERNIVRGTIGSMLPYAAVHEFGLVGHAPIKVSLHKRAYDKLGVIQKVRVSKKGKRTSALYKFDAEGNVVGYKTTLRAIAIETLKRKPDSGIVLKDHKEHWREKFKYRGRPFLRPAIEQSSEDIGRYVRRELAAIIPKA